MNTFRSPSIIITGEGSFQKVIELVQQHQAEKVHLFADPVLIRLNVLKPLAEAFEEKRLNLKSFLTFSLNRLLQPETGQKQHLLTQALTWLSE